LQKSSYHKNASNNHNKASSFVMKINFLWYFLPLLASVSLVYAGTRQERMRAILVQAVHTAVWIVGFMAAIAIILQILDAFS